MDDVQELYNLFPQLKGHIVIEKKVGQGTFSYVYSGHFSVNKNEKLALKYIIPTSSPSRTKQEIECLLNIGGKDNVIGVLSVLRNKSHILILMPFIDHVTFHDSFIFWSLNESKEYIKNLLIALNRVHQCGIIHRDIKPSNFLYEKQNKLFALVDFGLAQTYEKKNEIVFDYESTFAKKSSNNKSEAIPAKHNLIFLSKDNKKNSQEKKNKQSITTTIEENLTCKQKNGKEELIPITPLIINADHKLGLLNSNSFDSDLNKKDNISKDQNNSSSPLTISNLHSENIKNNTPNILNKPYLSSNFQKYYSFQKSSYSLSENKCTCFNMPFVCETCTSRTNKWAPRAGTAGFRAPEVLFRSTHQTPSVDIWSAGIIFLSILTGRYPFFKAIDDNMAIMQMISLFGSEAVRKAALKYGESLICSYDKKPVALKELCISLRQNVVSSLNTTSKTKFQPIINEPIIEFPETAYDLLKNLLELDCDKRFTASDALKHSFFQSP